MVRTDSSFESNPGSADASTEYKNSVSRTKSTSGLQETIFPVSTLHFKLCQVGEYALSLIVKMMRKSLRLYRQIIWIIFDGYQLGEKYM